MRSLVCGLGFALASSAAVVAAQTAADFSALRARVGDEIVVTSAEGVEIGGRVTKISPSALSIDGYAFTPSDAIKIERPGDSLWNGAAIGYGVGALFGMTIGAEACLHESTWRCVNAGGIALRAAWRAHRFRAPGTADDLPFAVGRAAKSDEARARHRPRSKGRRGRPGVLAV